MRCYNRFNDLCSFDASGEPVFYAYQIFLVLKESSPDIASQSDLGVFLCDVMKQRVEIHALRNTTEYFLSKILLALELSKNKVEISPDPGDWSEGKEFATEKASECWVVRLSPFYTPSQQFLNDEWMAELMDDKGRMAERRGSLLQICVKLRIGL